MPQRRSSNNVRMLRGQSARFTPAAPKLTTPKPPTWLSREAKTEWRRVVEAVARYPGWLQATDRAALTAYCAQWAVFEAAARDVAERGPLVPGRSSADQARRDDDGEPALVRNPAVQIMRDAAAGMRQWCIQLGFSPDARGRLNLGAALDDDDDDFDSPSRLLS